MPDVADLKVKISLDGADKVASGLKQADSSVHSFASNAGRLGGAVTSVAAQFAAFGVVAGGAVAAGLGAAVSKAADFEAGMSRVKAASGASASEMAQLGEKAIMKGDLLSAIQTCPRCGVALPGDARITPRRGSAGCYPVYKVTHAIYNDLGEKVRTCSGYTGPPKEQASK